MPGDLRRWVSGEKQTSQEAGSFDWGWSGTRAI